MSIYSFLSAICFPLYLEMALFILFKNTRDTKNWLLALSSLCLTVESVCQTFVYSAPNKQTIWLFYHIYSPLVVISLCFFLHFSLVLAGRAKSWKRYLPLLYLPVLVYGLKGILGTNVIKDFELHEGTWFEVAERLSAWTVSYYAFYYMYLLTSVWIIASWGTKSGLLKAKMQARTILRGAFVSVSISICTNFLQPLVLEKPLVPRITSITYLFLLFFVLYSMFRFDFLGVTPSLVEKNALWKVLSTREKTIVPLLYEGLTYKEIAFRLYISEGTLRKHMENIYRKTGINNKTKLVVEIFDLKKR